MNLGQNEGRLDLPRHSSILYVFVLSADYTHVLPSQIGQKPECTIEKLWIFWNYK